MKTPEPIFMADGPNYLVNIIYVYQKYTLKGNVYSAEKILVNENYLRHDYLQTEPILFKTGFN